ncbi:DUF5916 domain-containing protein [Acidobacteriota bacterium]
MKKPVLLLSFMILVQSYVFPASIQKKSYNAQPINPHPPVIDGNLEDTIWEKVEWGSNFVQIEPYEGKEPSQKTAFKILYDNKNIYVAIRAFDTEQDKIEKRLARRDNLDGDRVDVSIDSYHDLRTAFSFMINAAGVKGDEAISNDGNNRDRDWNPIWFVKTGIDEMGWTAEMRIPFSQLRFSKRSDHIWGLQVTRYFFRKSERSSWQFIPQDSPGFVHQFGELNGINGLKAPRQIELTPYTVGSLQGFKEEKGNPFATGTLSSLVGGLDGKIGITSDLTLNFTVNPDFGQVEADPSQVNLTAFETYFQEKRPFFIEGRNIISFQITGGDGDFSRDNLFYSRRIGRKPQHSPDTEDDEYIDEPGNTSIIGAFKLTGKTKNGLSIGVLNSVTANERAAISYLGQTRHEMVEPLTNYFGLRLQKDYNQGKTIFGGMLTATNRNIKNEDLNFLHNAAYTGGLDFYHSWKDKTYYFSIKTLFSHVRGDPEAIQETQESSLRYFQRPDADHVTLDPNRTSLSGHGGTVEIGKSGEGHLRFSTGVTWRSPGLELNDMGYQRYADTLLQWAWVAYRIWEPFGIFRQFNLNLNQWKGWNFGGENIFEGGNFNFYTQFKNYWGFNSGLNRQGESISASALRGGPSLHRPGGWNTWYNIHSDNRKKIRFNFGGSNYWGDFNEGNSNNIWVGLTYLPSNALTLSVQPNLSINKQNLQYVDTVDFDEEERYIFAYLYQKTLSVTFRLNFSITPELSIEFYGQPFISTGEYTRFKHITESRAVDFESRYHKFTDEELSYNSENEEFSIDENSNGNSDYTFENPDFNTVEFHSNLVVRWEYLPGSSLYLVWSQGRTGDIPIGDFSLRNDMQDLFNIHPHNVFLIKLSYCFNL